MDRLKKRAQKNRAAKAAKPAVWPEQYANAETGKVYSPHNDEEEYFVYSDSPRYMLLKGGEGGGKSTAGLIKAFNRLRRGMHGGMVSPDLEHFKKSLWPAFVNWCPWECVIARQQYRRLPGWEPRQAFTMVFKSEPGGFSYLICGGAQEDKISSWEGPNLSFLLFDESRRHRTPAAIKVFDGRIRIPGPNGEPPQMFLTTTPRKHWLYEYFGPIKDNDPHLAFKKDSYVATVLTSENEANLGEDFTEKRAQSLTESDARILLKAEWEDEEDTEKFVNIIWWDNNKQDLSPISRNESLVIALDAAKGTTGNTLPDCFAMIGVTRNPANKDNVAVRYCGIWQPQPGQLLDFGPIKEELKRLCKEFAVIEVAYDPYQLHDMCTTMAREGIAYFREFNQNKERLIADKKLQGLIAERRVGHDGNPLLRQHIDNAYIKKHGEEGVRIVKRTQSLKVDGAVALSMGCARILFYQV